MSAQPQQPAVVQTEKEFQAALIQYAKLQGFLCYHTFDSRRSEPGFPDVCMTRLPFGENPGRLIFVECKSLYGKLTRPQETWLKALGMAGAETHVWTQNDWPEIERVLSRRAA